MTAVTADARLGQTGGAFTGIGTLIRFVLRRDRVRIAIWVAAIVGTVLSTAAALPGLYLTAEARQARAALMANPAAKAIAGPGHGLEDYTFGAMMTQEMLGFTAVAVALMSILLLVRHTRAEEEAQRAELIRASIVGRHAGLAAALVVVAAINVVIGVLVGVGLGSLGVESIDMGSSLLFGAALASVGLAFTGVAAVTAQVTQNARGASGLGGIVLALTFVLRAAGDMGDGTLSWLSPIGWAHATRAYVDDRWWPTLLGVALFAVLSVAGMWLSTHRDIGSGLVPPRPGRPTASPALGSAFGLAARLQRGAFIGWLLSVLFFGLGYGTLVTEVEAFIAENPQLMEAFGLVDGEAAFIETFLATILSFVAMVVAIYGVSSVLRLRGEESAGHAEPVLATATSRPGWVASHLSIALVGPAIVLLAGALGLGLSASAATGDGSLVGGLLRGALVYIPALWVTVGLALALFGLVPRATALAWVPLVYALTVGMLGGLLGLPDWTLDLSPFGLVPLVPAEPFEAAPVLVLTAVAALLVAAGLVGFRRRDLTS